MSEIEMLAEVASQVLEDCAFLFLDGVDPGAYDPGDALASAIAISADRPRVLKLVASRPLLVEAAANMLGTEPDDPEALQSVEQAIGELLNVVAGSLVARIYGTETVCGLGIPHRAEPYSESDEGVVVMMRTDTGDFLRLELR